MPKLETGGLDATIPPQKKVRYRTGLRLQSADYILPAISFFISKVRLLFNMTPFGFAFFSAAYNGKIAMPVLVLCSVLLGNFSGVMRFPVKYVLANVLFVALYHVRRELFAKNSYSCALLSAVSLFFCGMYYVVLDGFLLYDLFALLLESTLTFTSVLVMKKAIPVLRSGRLRRRLSHEEFLSILIIIALLTAGLGSISLPFFATLQGTFAAYVVLVLSICFGAAFACPCAVAMGFLTGVSAPSMQATITAYSMSGLLSGVCGRYGKIAAGLSFLLGNIVISLCIGTSYAAIINPLDILLALALLLFTPKKFLKRVEHAVRERDSGRSYESAVKDLMLARLQDVSDSFFRLSLTLKEHVKSSKPRNFADASFVFDAAAEQVCQSCGKRFACWERNSITTYNAMVNMMELLERQGHLSLVDVPSHFRAICIRIGSFLEQVNRIYEANKVDYLWKSKMAQSKKMVTGQLLEVSKIIANLKRTMEAEAVCDPELQRELATALDQRGICPLQTAMLEYHGGVLAELAFRAELPEEQVHAAAAALSDFFGVPMVLDECREEETCVRYLFMPQARYCISTGAAQRCKDGEAECGDSYTFLRLSGGRFLCALSDGMGSGSRAKNESRTTISLLEDCMRSGFFRDAAIKMINSVTTLSSEEESYSTLDLILVDLNTLRAEFTKTGAVFSLIRSGASVRKVDAATLPVGILEKADYEVTRTQLQKGDYVILLSDGVLGTDQKGLWLKRFVAGLQPSTPQEMARRILDRAASRNDGVGSDDMSVLVFQIEESARASSMLA